MRHSTLAAVLLSSFLFCGLAFAQAGPESVVRGTKRFRINVVASELAGPWELTWGPDNQLWVTERTGKRVTRIDPVTGARSVAITIGEVSAPGGQDGLLGMALHPELLTDTGNDFVYVAYTYVDRNKTQPSVNDPASPYRHLYMKLVRLTYDRTKGELANPVNLVIGLPAGNDHNAGRLKMGPDRKLYLTIGDMGNNQLGNYCQPIESQRLPTQAEMDAKDFASYVGKSLRFNPDGSIPSDNPRFAGVVSHVYTYGHRNPQGLDFGPDGTLYSNEHGPKTDDEINILKAGANYGWPHVAGLRDDKAYRYARWAEASTPCARLQFSDLAIHPSVPREPESAFTKPFVEPIATMFTVPDGYNFADPACKGIDFICWPTAGVSSMEHYESKDDGIPSWDRVLLVTTLKRSSLYVVPLRADGQAVAGRMSRYFQSDNRFRDIAVHPGRRTLYIATDAEGLAEALAGGATTKMRNPGAILAFTYEGEGGATISSGAGTVDEVIQPKDQPHPVVVGGVPAQFMAAQAAAGRTAYNANCAVCHGSTMTNGTFGTPLAGEYFKRRWSGRALRAFHDKTKTMPPAAPGSLPDETYANIIAFIFEVNGAKAGGAPLPASGEAPGKATVP